jgi:hypothetical protein
MLKAIHAREDIVAAREKAVRVIDKLRGLRLTKAAELAEAGVEETLTYYGFPEEHWPESAPTILLERSSASSARSDVAPAWWARFLMVNLPSTRRGQVTAPSLAPRGRARDI